MQPSIFFSYMDYKELLNALIREQPRDGYGQLNQLSLKINVHSSLLSQVLRGDKHLSLEQGLKVAEFFRMTSRETEFFMLLLSYGKAGTPPLRKFYKTQLEALQQNVQTVTSRVTGTSSLKESDQAIYYSDWSYMAVWLATSLRAHRQVVEISDALGMNQGEVERILAELTAMGLVKATKAGFAVQIKKTHLAATSPLVKRHHINWRLKSIEQIPNVSSEELAFTAPMTLSVQDFKWLRNSILDLIEDASKRVADSDSEIMACLNVDLFKIGAKVKTN